MLPSTSVIINDCWWIWLANRRGLFVIVRNASTSVFSSGWRILILIIRSTEWKFMVQAKRSLQKNAYPIVFSIYFVCPEDSSKIVESGGWLNIYGIDKSSFTEIKLVQSTMLINALFHVQFGVMIWFRVWRWFFIFLPEAHMKMKMVIRKILCSLSILGYVFYYWFFCARSLGVWGKILQGN